MDKKEAWIAHDPLEAFHTFLAGLTPSAISANQLPAPICDPAAVRFQAEYRTVQMADFGMTRVRIGLFQHALAHPEANSERFESIEAKLDELRSYLYANRESVRGYAEAYRNGERISTAHVESTVNQLINWRMCKKHQMGWSRAGAQQLLHVKTAIINGRLDRYSGHHSVPAEIAA